MNFDPLCANSHTLFVGDSLLGYWGEGLSCCAAIHDDCPDFHSYLIRFCAADDDYTTDLEVMRSQVFGFGSWHDEVVNFTLVDGSGRAISKAIDGQLLRALATRGNGDRIASDL